jgi:hypothetical protein
MPKKAHQIFQYALTRNQLHPGFQEDMLSNMFSSGLAAALSAGLLNLTSRPRTEKYRPYLFSCASLFRSLIEGIDRDRVFLTGSIGLVRTAVPLRIPFQITGAQRLVLRKLFHSDPELTSKRAIALFQEVEDFLKTINPRAVVVSNDSLPDRRLLLTVAKRLSIPSFCIQDGLFQSSNDWRIWHGHFADHMLVWGEQQAEEYIKRGMPRSKVHVLGLPFPSIGENAPAPQRKNTLCILGQPWENVADELGKLKLDIFSNVIREQKKSGINCVYKPHPGEKKRDFFPPGIPIFRGSLTSAFRRFPVFASLTSTALLEATLHGRLAVQIYHPDFECDIFENIGYSYTIDANNIDQLANMVSTNMKPMHIPSCLIRINESPASQLVEIIENSLETP